MANEDEEELPKGAGGLCGGCWVFLLDRLHWLRWFFSNHQGHLFCDKATCGTAVPPASSLDSSKLRHWTSRACGDPARALDGIAGCVNPDMIESSCQLESSC